MENGDNVYAFPGGHQNPNAELLVQPDAFALIQFIDGAIHTSYETDNIVELIGAVTLLLDELTRAAYK